jgi:hypothetical protein
MLHSALMATAACFTALIGVNQGGPATATSNVVFVGGTVILRVQVGGRGMTPAQRAEEIQARLNQLLGAGPIAATDITVEPFGNEAAVRVKGKLLFTADWATARFNHSTPMDLANRWAENMRSVLPGLTQAK